MSIHDQQRREWEAFATAQHAKGLCEFSGRRVSQCVATICDCFETPEGAAEIERQANLAASPCGCYPHGADEPCTCGGCGGCSGRVVGCTCDIAWDCEHGDRR